jgi:flagellar assembly factor FliW
MTSTAIATSRFGRVDIEPDDVIHFPQGIMGMEDCRDWVLLVDSQNDLLRWLQSTKRPEVALAVVSPRSFVADYKVRVAGRELAPLQLDDVRQAQVMVIVAKSQETITLNLRAPLVIHPEARLGCQIVTKDPHPIQYVLETEPAPLRKSA